MWTFGNLREQVPTPLPQEEIPDQTFDRWNGAFSSLEHPTVRSRAENFHFRWELRSMYSEQKVNKGIAVNLINSNNTK